MENDKKEFKKYYTDEDLLEIKAWYDRHKADIPETLQLNAATFYKDLRGTVESYFMVYETHGLNPALSGHYYQLYLIRNKLREMGLVND